MAKTLKKNSRKIDKEEGKPRTPTDIEIQGQRPNYSDDGKYISDLVPMPSTPYGCPRVSECERRAPEPGKAGSNLRIEFTDWNDEGLRYKDGPYEKTDAKVSLFVDPDFLDNSTNRTLACLCFFQWDGSNYNQISLSKEGHDDLKYVAIGNISQIDIELTNGQQVRSLGEKVESSFPELYDEKEMKE